MSEANKMKKQQIKWQYIISGFLGWTHEEVISSLNKLGKEGWQLVQRGESHHSWLFKRQIFMLVFSIGLCAVEVAAGQIAPARDWSKWENQLHDVAMFYDESINAEERFYRPYFEAGMTPWQAWVVYHADHKFVPGWAERAK